MVQKITPRNNYNVPSIPLMFDKYNEIREHDDAYQENDSSYVGTSMAVDDGDLICSLHRSDCEPVHIDASIILELAAPNHEDEPFINDDYMDEGGDDSDKPKEDTSEDDLDTNFNTDSNKGINGVFATIPTFWFYVLSFS